MLTLLILIFVIALRIFAFIVKFVVLCLVGFVCLVASATLAAYSRHRASHSRG